MSTTPEEYLELDREAEFKSEYYAGEMFAMSGNRRPHILIVGNLLAALHRELRTRPCEVYSTEMRVEVSSTGLYAYPDLVVVCGVPQFRDERQETLLNPTLIVEVMSESTAGNDRGPKCEHYRSIPTLAEYLLISTDHVHAELFTRLSDSRWAFRMVNGLEDGIDLSPIGCRLSLAEIYEKLDLPSGAYPPIRAHARET